MIQAIASVHTKIINPITSIHRVPIRFGNNNPTKKLGIKVAPTRMIVDNIELSQNLTIFIRPIPASIGRNDLI
jgi:hypothetical protein